jgi:hypothetical protein
MHQKMTICFVKRCSNAALGPFRRRESLWAVKTHELNLINMNLDQNFELRRRPFELLTRSMERFRSFGLSTAKLFLTLSFGSRRANRCPSMSYSSCSCSSSGLFRLPVVAQENLDIVVIVISGASESDSDSPPSSPL